MNFRGKEISILLFAVFFFVFNFFIYGPIEIYITNISELWFSMSDIIPLVFLTAIIVCFILAGIGLVLPKRLCELYNCVLLGISLGLYIQGNWIKTDYGVLDGHDIDWSSYSGVAIWNTLVWLICLALPFVVKYICKSKYKKYIKLGTICILLMQIITLSTLIFITDFEKYPKDHYYLTDKDLYTVSNNKNIIIFILDAFDERYLDMILEQEPDFLDGFDGFTYYTNATCSYPTTKGSMPYILTGQFYKNEQEYDSYVREAYNNTNYYDILSEAGYDIGLYTYDFFVSNDAKKTFVNNAESGKILVNSHIGLEKAMLRFTAFRYFPHILKKHVWFYSGIFDNYKTSQSEFSIFSNDNMLFYKGLIEERLQFCDDKIYHLIHLRGTHPPFELNADITYADEGEATVASAGMACLNIVREYISQLKELGVYDDSLIIITADHGQSSAFKAQPIFMLKKFNNNEFVKQNNLAVSHSNIMPTVLDAIDCNTEDYIYNSLYEDIKTSDIYRKHLYYQWDNDWDKEYLPDMTEYEIDNNGVYFYTGKKYTSQGEIEQNIYEYEVNDTIYFNSENDGTRYFVEGISVIENDSVWSEDQTSKMIIDCGEYTDTLIGKIKFKNIFNSPQRLIISCEEHLLFDAEVSSVEDEIFIEIPSECIKNGKLIIDFSYPDAISPIDLDISNDTRVLAFQFYSISFSEVSKYNNNTKIFFSEKNDGRKYFIYGISGIENDFAWSLGNNSEILIEFQDDLVQSVNLIGRFEFRSVYTGQQHLIVKSGDEVLYDDIVTRDNPNVEFEIPIDCLSDGILTLDLEYPDAISPLERDESTDSRVLAFAFNSISFTQKSNE